MNSLSAAESVGSLSELFSELDIHWLRLFISPYTLGISILGSAPSSSSLISELFIPVSCVFVMSSMSSLAKIYPYSFYFSPNSGIFGGGKI